MELDFCFDWSEKGQAEQIRHLTTHQPVLYPMLSLPLCCCSVPSVTSTRCTLLSVTCKSRSSAEAWIKEGRMTLLKRKITASPTTPPKPNTQVHKSPFLSLLLKREEKPFFSIFKTYRIRSSQYWSSIRLSLFEKGKMSADLLMSQVAEYTSFLITIFS